MKNPLKWVSVIATHYRSNQISYHVFLYGRKHNLATESNPPTGTTIQPSAQTQAANSGSPYQDLDASTQQPETGFQAMSNNDDGTYMQTMIARKT